MNPITLATTSASDAFSEFTSIASSAMSFIWDNWYLAVILAVPLGIFVVSSLMGLFRR